MKKPTESLGLTSEEKLRKRRQFITTGVGITAAAVLPVLVSGTASAIALTPRHTPPPRRKGGHVLIINAHQTYPGMSAGRLNKTLAELIGEEMR